MWCVRMSRAVYLRTTMLLYGVYSVVNRVLKEVVSPRWPPWSAIIRHNRIANWTWKGMFWICSYLKLQDVRTDRGGPTQRIMQPAIRYMAAEQRVSQVRRRCAVDRTDDSDRSTEHRPRYWLHSTQTRLISQWMLKFLYLTSCLSLGGVIPRQNFVTPINLFLIQPFWLIHPYVDARTYGR